MNIATTRGRHHDNTNQLRITAYFFSQGRYVTTSRDIAEYFDKQHQHITQKVESLDCSAQFITSNFSLVHFQHNGNTYKMYEITKDGFMFLVMGFTGKKAAHLKEAYIARFNAMEAELTRSQSTATTLPAPAARYQLLLTVEQNQVVNTELVAPGCLLLHPDDAVELLRRAGYVVIHHKELNSVPAAHIATLCSTAAREEQRWARR